jgi:hypothetical protein
MEKNICLMTSSRRGDAKVSSSQKVTLHNWRILNCDIRLKYWRYNILIRKINTKMIKIGRIYQIDLTQISRNVK